MVELSNGDVTSGLRHRLAAEIDKRPLLTSQNTHITCERYTIDSKHVLNTNRKPWSTNRLVTSYPVCDVILHFSRLTCVKSELKIANNWEIVRSRGKVSTEHL
jgi:hypothetical protein